VSDSAYPPISTSATGAYLRRPQQCGTSAPYIPSAGHLWDVAQRKGLTYRSYGEYAARASTGTTMDAHPESAVCRHVAKDTVGSRRDTGILPSF